MVKRNSIIKFQLDTKYLFKTFTGLSINYLGFWNFHFEINSVMNLLLRAYGIPSFFYHLHSELHLQFNYFHANCYPIPLTKSKLIQVSICKFTTSNLLKSGKLKLVVNPVINTMFNNKPTIR